MECKSFANNLGPRKTALTEVGMFLGLDGILTPDEVRSIRARLEDAAFADGKATAGWHARLVKDNAQLAGNDPAADEGTDGGNHACDRPVKPVDRPPVKPARVPLPQAPPRVRPRGGLYRVAAGRTVATASDHGFTS